METNFDRRIFQFFTIWYVIGVFLLSFSLVPPWLEWANVVFLITSGVVSMLFFYRSSSKLSGIFAIAVIFILSMAIESFGVHTGLFFGEYTYLGDFGPKVAGVPITIGFAWVMVMAVSHVMASGIISIVPKLPGLVYALYGAIIAVSLDLIIDPVAYEVKQYWVWHESGLYYGIPFSNFLGWFILSFILHLVLYALFSRGTSWTNRRSRPWKNRMIWLFGMMNGMFIIVAFAHGLMLAPVLSLSLTAVYYGIYYIMKGGRK
ncbi:carotenoid biosynthesis protein [Salisediminibacterium halotolerans]|uniref:carotenoid biosynthesis protein n=1 Tax=Salisediminibacterium halotolerans TaxID=517425 RepID=UPI000EB06688|nr:carotenoid biosynthesis protein [Salisediminibacterium halotolerans]RLJ78016.1 putative membrane protein [Actinophytocola xinjiangensis]RPE88646.1 putative membrane protein [Salisediminibacterium halotolerans]TWG36993.1 putative membrane protein [Salisediminibacterium halotolerans]GEL08472.1 hypothetical protein SHA02_18880 [Salisediminibacterium halotolerans]